MDHTSMSMDCDGYDLDIIRVLKQIDEKNPQGVLEELDLSFLEYSKLRSTGTA